MPYTTTRSSYYVKCHPRLLTNPGTERGTQKEKFRAVRINSTIFLAFYTIQFSNSMDENYSKLPTGDVFVMPHECMDHWVICGKLN